MNSRRESYMRDLHLRPQNTEFTTLAFEKLGTQKFTSSRFISQREDRVCRAWTHGS